MKKAVTAQQAANAEIEVSAFASKYICNDMQTSSAISHHACHQHLQVALAWQFGW